MRYLRQSTTVTIQVGPFLDSTDGVTPENALSPTVQVSKAGAAFGARSSATAIAFDADGFYRVELNTTDTNTVGATLVKSFVSGAAPVWHEFTILPQTKYDSFIAGTVVDAANLTQIDGLTTAGNLATLNLKELRLINPAGNGLTCQGGAAATAGAHFSSTNTVGTGVKMTGSGVGYGLHLEQTGNNPALYVRAVGDVGAWIESTSNEGMTITSAANSPALRLLAQGNGSALKCEGGATGIGAEFIGGGASAGIKSTGGSTGHGVELIGGATSGDGINATATNGDGIDAAGGTFGHGIKAVGGALGNGMDLTGGASAGHGLRTGASSAGAGIVATGFGSGAHGITATGGTNGSGISAAGAGTGSGLTTTGGATGNGIEATGGASGASGLFTQGTGAYPGVFSEGGPTGDGVQFVGGTTSGHGLRARAQANSDGIYGLGAGTGKALGDNIVDSILTRAGIAEPVAVPSYPASLASSLGWNLALQRNKMTQSSTTQTLRNDADSATIATATHSVAAGVHTRGEFS